MNDMHSFVHVVVVVAWRAADAIRERLVDRTRRAVKRNRGIRAVLSYFIDFFFFFFFFFVSVVLRLPAIQTVLLQHQL
jgi:hypothetical protein